MKPEGAEELAVASDLSETSLGEAIDKLVGDLDVTEYRGWIRLTVPSQQVGLAIILTTIFQRVYLELAPDHYEKDEWSVTLEQYDIYTKGGGEWVLTTRKKTIWSPGA